MLLFHYQHLPKMLSTYCRLKRFRSSRRTLTRLVPSIKRIRFYISLLLTFINQTVMSSPISSSRAIPTGPEYWRNPCGIPVEANDPPYSDNVLADHYALELSTDLLYVNNWKDSFCSNKFKMTFDEKVLDDVDYRYDWLEVAQTIPKQPGAASLGDSYYSQKQFTSMLIESSNILQRIAIGWEQVALDSDSNPDHASNFTKTRSRIKNTLCSSELYLADKGMPPAPNPTRSIMKDDLRTLTAQSQIDLRNFRILKEYVVALEYYAEAFNYFKNA